MFLKEGEVDTPMYTMERWKHIDIITLTQNGKGDITCFSVSLVCQGVTPLWVSTPYHLKKLNSKGLTFPH